MLGAIIRVIVGSVYEFRNHRSKVFQPFFLPNAFYTDDTVCTIAVAAITFGVAETMFGVSDDVAAQGWKYLPADVREVLTELYRHGGVTA